MCPEFILAMPAKRRTSLWKYLHLDDWNSFNPDDSSCVDAKELFAVATELFYEEPQGLRRLSPEIYDCLMKLYRCDPVVEIPKKQKLKLLKNIWSAILEKLK